MAVTKAYRIGVEGEDMSAAGQIVWLTDADMAMQRDRGVTLILVPPAGNVDDLEKYMKEHQAPPAEPKVEESKEEEEEIDHDDEGSEPSFLSPDPV